MSSEPGGEIEKVRILIADPHELFRLGLSAVFSHCKTLRIVAQTDSGPDALTLAAKLAPDIAIVDLALSQHSGIRTVTEIAALTPKVKVIALSTHMAAPVLRKTRRAGASCLLGKDGSVDEYVTALKKVRSGAPFFASDSAHRNVAKLSPDEQIPVQLLLSDREIDVLRLMAEGLSNKKIAAALGISVRTAEVYRADIFSRAGAKSLADLVRRAFLDGAL
jgi:DNA-binding NarL/FixJ family response regulator